MYCLMLPKEKHNMSILMFFKTGKVKDLGRGCTTKCTKIVNRKYKSSTQPEEFWQAAYRKIHRCQFSQFPRLPSSHLLWKGERTCTEEESSFHCVQGLGNLLIPSVFTACRDKKRCRLSQKASLFNWHTLKSRDTVIIGLWRPVSRKANNHRPISYSHGWTTTSMEQSQMRGIQIIFRSSLFQSSYCSGSTLRIRNWSIVQPFHNTVTWPFKLLTNLKCIFY